MLIDVGQVVAKKYELVRLLGRGSMGEVWAAHHQALREQVALKVLSWPPSGDDAEDASVALERFRFEAQVAARLSRKTRHIARVTDYGEDDGLPYLVMELLDGEALDAALRQRGPLPLTEVSQIVSQIARALGQAHAESVAHRDLKPANVFLTRDEEGRLLVKLLDFGIARTIHAHRVQGTFTTAKGFVFGTPGYMSPEQTRASPKLDHRCDLWSLATIAYQMLTCELPVDGADSEEIMKNLCAGRIVPLRQRNADLPDALGAFFDRAFADKIDDRFESAAVLAQAFELASGVAYASLPPPPPPTPSSPDTSTGTEFSASVASDAMSMHRRTRTRFALASVGVLAAAILTVVGLWRGFTSPRTPESTSGSTAALPSEPVRTRTAGDPPADPSASSAVVPSPALLVPQNGASSTIATAPAVGAPAVAGLETTGPATAAPGTAGTTDFAPPAIVPLATERPHVAARSPARQAAPPDVKAARAPRVPRGPAVNERPADDRNDVF